MKSRQKSGCWGGDNLPNEKMLHLIPCDKDCYYQQQGYCTLDGVARITNFHGDGCGYFTQTDPYQQEE